MLKRHLAQMREALSSLELLVVIDVAMTETARLSHYVLPAPSQFEKYEATYFNLEFPKNTFHLRHPLMEALPGTLPEPEIHARLVEALGALTPEDPAPLKAAAEKGRGVFAKAFFTAMTTNPVISRYAPVVLYRTLGPTLENGAAAAEILWAGAHLFVQANPAAAARAGFAGDPFTAGEKLFDAILNSPSGLVFAADEYEDSWKRVRTPGGKINLTIPDLLAELPKLTTEPLRQDPAYPFILSAGERRSETTNTIIRNSDWRKKSRHGALRVGVSVNELTATEDRDFLAGTPWHKHVPARLERL